MTLLDYVMRFPKAIFDYMVARAHKSAEWIALHVHARAAAAAVGMPDHEMLSLNGLAIAHSVSGDHDAAITCLEDMLRIARAEGDTSRLYLALNNLVIAHLRSGNVGESLRYGTELLNSPWVTGDPRNEGSARVTMASAYLLGQNYAKAIEQARAALPLCTEVGLRLAVASARQTIASALAGQGDLASSVAEYELALLAYRELDVPYLEGDTLLELGDVHHRLGQDGSARECWRAALDLFERTGSPRSTEALGRLADGTNPSGAQESPPGPTRVV
ncbi:Anaphase-promoting complex subunit 5 [Actinokineospora alba]|uniref:Anaphase-promoting complex subunit 5 n=1 Tax=Actinokineospora alba TaxID=504798 RepID=A0A1H0V5P0_9PSEU|nr:tetratricopeptide repeat protein [Actinokineospora alba]SDH63481.1 Anaphase-promoting complex subunit 5 [Actinokineospora alba]SDP73760.1 Anaphase-promoting complex subunit 5 [Actinokineospora alba]